MPEGWQNRLVRVETPRTRGAVGLCLEIHDLVISKYVADREKDLEFIRVAAAKGMVNEKTLRRLLEGTPIEKSARQRIAGFISRDFS